MLLDRQLSLIAGIVAATIAGLLAIEPIPVALYAFISCAAAVYGIKRYRERQSVTLAGLWVARLILRGDCVDRFFPPAFVNFSRVGSGLFGIGGGLLTIIFAAGGVPSTNRSSGS
jgi:hypothetical protein